MYTVVALAALFWIITALLGGAGCVSLVRALRLQRLGAETTGRIVAHFEDTESSNVVAIVEYVVEGISHRIKTNVYLPPRRHPIGAARRVAYMPGDPGRAEVAGANRYAAVIALWIATIVIGALATALTYALV